MATGKIVAMKEMSFADSGQRRGTPLNSVMHEISILNKVKHRKIVNLLDFFSTETKITLVFEYCLQDLQGFQAQRGYHGVLHPPTVLSFLKQLLKGIKFCHDNNIYHRDLKPQNVLVKKVREKYVIKIADFGLACTSQRATGAGAYQVRRFSRCRWPLY